MDALVPDVIERPHTPDLPINAADEAARRRPGQPAGIGASSDDVTQLLRQWRDGNKDALDELFPVVYQELRRLAARYLRRERPGHTLRPTALVHEAFLRLIDQQRVSWQNRAHFFGLAAQMMRRILVNHALSRQAAKRGGHLAHVTLDEERHGRAEQRLDIVALDEALKTLAALNGRQARVVELRYFGGLTVEETAEVVGISAATVKREWAAARLFLLREISRQ
jgi:RNA polymerase sigma factor (TIGR02999 family)